MTDLVVTKAEIDRSGHQHSKAGSCRIKRIKNDDLRSAQRGCLIEEPQQG
jgi:hypothetical protein